MPAGVVMSSTAAEIGASTSAAREAPRGFAGFAAFVLVYLLAVILFGAWVRISGSGAGCGEHWPTCHGELLPSNRGAAMMIELTHRVTSAASGLLAIVLPVLAWRRFPKGHAVRAASLATLLLILVEGGIGAGLVLNRLVGEDASALRALVVALHLVNTLLLTACSALALYWSLAPPRMPLRVAWARAGAERYAYALWLVGLVLISASGAVTALGDTLFVNPAGLPMASPPDADHFLVRLRVVHPIAAVLLSLLGAGIVWGLAQRDRLRRAALGLGALLGAQLVLGAFNIAFGAPGVLQLAHLLLAQLVWLGSVVLLRRALEQPAGRAVDSV
jgi:cytochrome c oxidase assembly protein subunit 15